MLFDNQNLFSNDQVLTAIGPSSNIIDLGTPGTPLGAPTALIRDIGEGRRIPLLVKLMAAAGGTLPTLDVALQIDTTDAFSSPTTIAPAPQLAGGALGDEIALHFIRKAATDRYLRLLYTLGGTSPTYTVTAGIVAARAERLAS